MSKGADEKLHLIFRMKTLRVTVRFPRGLHARPAASLVPLFGAFQARVFLRLGNRVANAGSFLSILLLSATLNAQLEIQATGEDEEAAIRAAEAFFQSDNEEKAQQVYLGTLPGSQSPESP